MGSCAGSPGAWRVSRIPIGIFRSPARAALPEGELDFRGHRGAIPPDRSIPSRAGGPSDDDATGRPGVSSGKEPDRHELRGGPARRFRILAHFVRAPDLPPVDRSEISGESQDIRAGWPWGRSVWPFAGDDRGERTTVAMMGVPRGHPLRPGRPPGCDGADISAAGRASSMASAVRPGSRKYIRNERPKAPSPPFCILVRRQRDGGAPSTPVPAASGHFERTFWRE